MGCRGAYLAGGLAVGSSIGVSEVAQAVGQPVENLSDPDAALTLKRKPKLADGLVKASPQLRVTCAVEVGAQLRRWFQVGGGVWQRTPGEALAVRKAKSAALLLGCVGEL